MATKLKKMPFDASTTKRARQHLRKHDPVMRAIIDEVGPFSLRLERDRFAMLVRSIISQQISVGAARSIRKRLEQLVAPDRVTPDSLLRFEIDELRGAGLSPQKATYLHDLASKVHDGSVTLRTIGRHDDEVVIEQLTQVKGIGRWTAQMFLIFALGRPDVFPEDDLGIRNAIRINYGFDGLPDKATARDIAQPWRPFASYASWYCWRSIDQLKRTASTKTGYLT